MKKHIIGLALFSFIVSATAVVYTFFGVPEIVPVFQAKTISFPQSYSARYSCKMKRQSNSIEITQAVFNAQTKQFDWELATSENDSMIALHFFSKEAKGTRLIRTELVSNGMTRDGKPKLSNSLHLWLNNRKSFDNLYVAAEYVPEAVYELNYTPVFDAAKATAVTVDYGE